MEALEQRVQLVKEKLREKANRAIDMTETIKIYSYNTLAVGLVALGIPVILAYNSLEKYVFPVFTKSKNLK